MSASARNAVLDGLREKIGRLDRGSMRDRIALPFGLETIDRHLPGGGLMRGTLHEISGGGDDYTHGAAAALFIGGALARLAGPVLWCLRRRDLFAPGLAGVGLHPDRVIYVEAGDAATVPLLMEEGLKHAGLAGVVGEVDRLGLTAARRLNLAAETSGVIAFALRRGRFHGDIEKPEPTAAMTRWRITAMPSAALPVPGLATAIWKLELTRCRNGEAASWTVEACDGQGYLAAPRVAVSADLANRPAPAERTWRRYAG